MQKAKREKEESERKAALEQAEVAQREAQERVIELEAALEASRDRENSLASTLDTMGHSSLSLGGMYEWSSADARALLEEEEEANARVDELLTRVRTQRSDVVGMIEQQEALALKLGVAA